MTRIAWHPLARLELLEAAEYYDQASNGLGEVFIDSVEAALRPLSGHPQAGTPIERQLRRLLVDRFPYSLIYRLTDQPSQQVLVLAVAHQKRRPGYWATRT